MKSAGKIIQSFASFLFYDKLTVMNVMLCFSCRSIKNKGSDSWREAYATIIKLTQEAMLLEYGGELKLHQDINVL